MPALLAASIFSFMPPNRQDLSAQGNFTGHRNKWLDPFLGKDGSQSRQHGDPGRRTIFWNGSLRNMQVNIVFFKHFIVNTQLLTVSLDKTQSGGYGFFHNIAKVTRQGQFSFTFIQTGLDKENISPHTCPGQANSYSGHINFLV